MAAGNSSADIRTGVSTSVNAPGNSSGHGQAPQDQVRFGCQAMTCAARPLQICRSVGPPSPCTATNLAQPAAFGPADHVAARSCS